MDIKEKIKELSIEEKLSFLRGKDFWTTQAINSLNLKEIRMSDGPHGLRKEENVPKTDFETPTAPAVCFPTASLTSCSFDRDLLFKMGDRIAKEALNQGVDIVLGPGINIKRNPLCGRNFEYFSEDPYLAGELASSYIKGVEQNNVGTSLKHFCVNSVELDRARINEIVDERALFEIYLEGFRNAIVNGKPASIMSSYNKVNGEYVGESKYLLKDVLRDKWGFEGFVVSDWGAVNNTVKAVKNGMNLEMPYSYNYNYFKLLDAYRTKELSDDDVNRVVEENYYCFKRYENNKKIDVNYEDDHKFAVEVAKNSLVLLKNDGILPLKAEDTVLFVGELINRPRFQGGGSSAVNPFKVSQFLNEIKNYTSHYSYLRGYDSSSLSNTKKLTKEVIDNLNGKNKVVLFVGSTPTTDYEGGDRPDCKVNESQLYLIKELLNVKKEIAIVLETGGVIELGDFNKDVNAILLAYLGGEGINEAIISTLYGENNPSGRLSETWFKDLKETPVYNYLTNNRIDNLHKESIFVGYRYYGLHNENVLYPFGFGLSYSSVEYNNFEIDKNNVEKEGKVKISFDIVNNSDLDHKEVVQVYVGKSSKKVFNPKRELKHFEKVEIKAHSSLHVETYIDYEKFSYYDINKHDYVVLKDDYWIEVCKDSETPIKTFNVFVDGEEIESPYKNKGKKYFLGDIKNLTDDEFKEIDPKIEIYDENMLGVKHDWNSSVDYAISKNSKGAKFLRFVFNHVGAIKNNNQLYGVLMTSPIRQMIYFANFVITEEQANLLIKVFNDEHYIKNGIKFLSNCIKLSKNFRG